MTVRIFIVTLDFQFKELDVDENEITEEIDIEHALAFSTVAVAQDHDNGMFLWPADKPLPQFIKSRLLVSPVAPSDSGR